MLIIFPDKSGDKYVIRQIIFKYHRVKSILLQLSCWIILVSYNKVTTKGEM